MKKNGEPENMQILIALCNESSFVDTFLFSRAYFKSFAASSDVKTVMNIPGIFYFANVINETIEKF